MLDTQHVMQEIGECERAVLKSRGEHGCIRHKPEVAALQDVGPGRATRVETCCVNFYLSRVHDLHAIQTGIPELFLQLRILVDDQRVVFLRIIEQLETISLRELRIGHIGLHVPRIAPDIHAHPNERPCVGVQIGLDAGGQCRLAPCRSDIKTRIVERHITRDILTNRLARHLGVKVREEVLQFERIHFTQPGELAGVVIKHQDIWSRRRRLALRGNWAQHHRHRQSHRPQPAMTSGPAPRYRSILKD